MTADSASSFAGPHASIWRAFAQGLSKPSACSLATACLTAAALCVWAATTIEPDFMIRHGWIFADSARDPHVTATQRALLLNADRGEKPSLLLLGNLARRAAIDDKALRDEFAAVQIEDQRVFDLRTPDQTLWETLTLIDRIPRAAHGRAALVLVPDALEASPHDLALARRQPRLALRSPSVQIELDMLNRSDENLRGQYFYDNHVYFLNHAVTAVTNLWRGAPAADESTGMPPRPLADTAYSLEYVEVNLATLDRLLARLTRDREFRAVIEFQVDEAPPYLDELQALADKWRAPLVVAPAAAEPGGRLSPQATAALTTLSRHPN